MYKLTITFQIHGMCVLNIFFSLLIRFKIEKIFIEIVKNIFQEKKVLCDNYQMKKRTIFIHNQCV